MALSYFCSVCGAENEPGDALCRACQQPLAGSSDTSGPAHLLNERYEILTEVGAGGFGAVYKARDTQEANQVSLVAVKQINLKGLTPQEIIEATNAFNREAEILTALSHPLLPRIFDRFSDAEHWYLVMNFIDGQTLDDYLAQHGSGGLALSETLEIALSLCDVLHYLHTQQPPVIFRDLKPGNIMRTRRGQLYLIDFGIARRFKPGQARDTIPFGSPGFAAPEQYGKAQTTPRADIYSLGALLYCLISGDDPSEHPFQFPPLRVYGVTGMPELNALIQRMVEPAPEERPTDIQEVRAELQRIRLQRSQTQQRQRIWIPPQGQTPGASTSGQQQIFFTSPATSQTPARKTTRRLVLTIGLLAGGAALVGGVALAAASQGSPGAASQPAQVIDGDHSGLYAEYTAMAQGNDIATTAVAQNAVIPLDGPVFWSQDMNYAAVVNQIKHQFKIYALKQKQKQPLVVNFQFSPNPSINEDWTWGQWSVDNRTLFLQSNNGSIEAWDTRSGRMLFQRLAAVAADLRGAALSPDGQYCAINYTDNTSRQNFELLQVNGGKKLLSSQNANYIADSMGWSSDSRYLLFANLGSQDSNGKLPWSARIWDRYTYQFTNALKGSLTAVASWDTGGLLAVVWSPSNTKVSFMNSYHSWFVDLNTGRSADLPVDGYFGGGPTYGPVWSPSEEYLAAIDGPGSLIAWNMLSQQAVQPAGTGSQSNLVSFAWSADSRSILTADMQNVLAHWSIA